jgi:hypothetical protein
VHMATIISKIICSSVAQISFSRANEAEVATILQRFLGKWIQYLYPLQKSLKYIFQK